MKKSNRHFEEVYQRLGSRKKNDFAKAYRYSHCYDSHMEVEQQILEKNTGVLLIHELPDTVKKKETEAQAYASCLGSDGKTGKESAHGFCFLRPGLHCWKINKTYDEIGIFLPNSHFLKNLERHVAKAEAILYG